ncbi:amidohydrolase family protein [Marinimicrobium alkaliphilum]|uniref:amidohydrolase family protein n=1 Tax=Marinimicrobium alkaliphilum TaxID=2202654 RepID=UPI000DBABC2C|nr:amidohydrolase family protein [Marinimicrobium alkaliphilum]
MSVAILDAHQHCWQLGKHACQWPTPELEAIYRDFMPADFLAEAEGSAVTGSILVQSQPALEDTHFLLDLARQHRHILGVVGWVDLSAESAVADIARLARDPKLVGLRPMLQGLDADDWILTAARPEALATMAEHGLVLDALVYSRHLPFIHTLAARQPDLRIVLDHAAKPDIARREGESWERPLAELAACPNVYCKLSGLATEMSPDQPWESMLPYIRHLLGAFGPERVLWGSDWPVLNLAGDYSRWLSYCWQAVEEICPLQVADVFCHAAERAYRVVNH